MTVIALHPHVDVQWVSWRGPKGFGRIHLEREMGRTLCGDRIPTFGYTFTRVVRNQTSAAIEDLCKRCLKEYATHHEEHQ